jgi:hypothetical protein
MPDAALAGARVAVDVRLQRVLDGDQRRIVGGVSGADADVGAAQHQRLEVRLLRLLVHVVGLPHVVQVFVAGVVALVAEALGVEAVLVGVRTQRGRLITSAVMRSPNSRRIAGAMNRIGCSPS